MVQGSIQRRENHLQDSVKRHVQFFSKQAFKHWGVQSKCRLVFEGGLLLFSRKQSVELWCILLQELQFLSKSYVSFLGWKTRFKVWCWQRPGLGKEMESRWAANERMKIKYFAWFMDLRVQTEIIYGTLIRVAVPYKLYLLWERMALQMERSCLVEFKVALLAQMAPSMASLRMHEMWPGVDSLAVGQWEGDRGSRICADLQTAWKWHLIWTSSQNNSKLHLLLFFVDISFLPQSFFARCWRYSRVEVPWVSDCGKQTMSFRILNRNCCNSHWPHCFLAHFDPSSSVHHVSIFSRLLVRVKITSLLVPFRH